MVGDYNFELSFKTIVTMYCFKIKFKIKISDNSFIYFKI